jgi:hypothetical protein
VLNGAICRSPFLGRYVWQSEAATAAPADTPSVGLFCRFRLRLAGLLFSPLFQGRFARKLYAAFVINANALHPNDVPNFSDVFGPFNPEIRQLRYVHESIFSRKNFDECAKLFR